jgi:adenylate cyclase
MAGLDHAAKAIGAARALLFATGHGSLEGPWIPVGAGVHTGVAFVGSVGDRGVSDFTALGDAVNTAARVASMAGAGETPVTRAAIESAELDGDHEWRHLELRGRTKPVDVAVVRASPSPMPA